MLFCCVWLCNFGLLFDFRSKEPDKHKGGNTSQDAHQEKSVRIASTAKPTKHQRGPSL